MNRLLLSLCLVLASTAALAQTDVTAEDGIGWSLQRAITKQTETIAKSTGQSINRIEVRSAEAAGTYVVDASYSGNYRDARILISGVTAENVAEKGSQAATLLVVDIRERQKVLKIAKHFTTDVLSDSYPVLAPTNTFGFELGMPTALTTWVQLPSLRGENADSLGGGKTHWLKTTVSLDGQLHGWQSAEGKPVAVARVATAIWEVGDEGEDVISDAAFSVRLGAVKGAVKLQPGATTLTRGDIDVIDISMIRALGTDWVIRPYFATSMMLGLRLLEENAAAIQTHMGIDVRFGVIIANRLFVAGKLSSDAAGKYSRYTYGLEAGWRISKRFTVKVGVDHNDKLSDKDQYDLFYNDPQGWNYMTTLGVHF